MPRRKMTAAEYIDKNDTLVPLILGDMIEHLGRAVQEWSDALAPMRRGDLDKALEHVVSVGIEADIPLKVGRSEIRAITERAGNLLDQLLPDDDEPLPAVT
jgi:hypothetical protein